MLKTEIVKSKAEGMKRTLNFFHGSNFLGLNFYKIIPPLLSCAWMAAGNSTFAENNQTQIIINESFADDSGFKALNINPKEWLAVGGELRNVPGVMKKFTFGDDAWNDYDIEFKLRRLEVSPKDQHFGVLTRLSPEGETRLYSRGDSVIYMTGARHGVLGSLPRPMAAAPDAPWTSFRIAVKGARITVHADSALIGSVDNVTPAAGKISFYAYGVDIAIKDLKVVVSRAGEKNTVSDADSKNILHNSSFEQCTLDDLPDYWGCPHWGLADSYWATRFEEWQKNFITDKTEASDGKRSLRIINPDSKPNSALTLWSVVAGAKMNETYTLSAYMRSSPAGVKVKMGSADGKQETFTLTDEWRRYSTVFIREKNGLYADMVQIEPQGKGSVWIDAVQLENGPLTDYQPMKNERQQLQAEEGNVNKILTEVPKYEPPYFDENIPLTGKLDDRIWEKVPKMKFVTLSGGSVKDPTEAQVWYSGKGLYIGVKCYGRNANQNKCSVTSRDGNVWNDSSLEFFIDPQLSRNYYYHLAVNQIGTQYDGFNGDMSWNGDWKAVTHTDPEGKYWSAELFLPFGEFGIDPTIGDWQGFNICRENHALKEYSCWSPTFGSFHNATRFGQISVDRKVMENYFVGCSGAQLNSISSKSAALAVNLFNNTGRNQDYTLSARITDPKNQEIAKFSLPASLQKGASQTVALGNINCTAGVKYRLELNLVSKENGVLRYSGVKDLETPESAALLTQYDIYTKETMIRAKVNLNIGDDLLTGAQMTLKICDSEGKEVLRKAVYKVQRETETEISIVSLKNGDYILNAELITASESFSSSRKFRKLPPRENEVKADHFSRMMTVNGKTFFPAGIALEGNSAAECIKYYAENGFNSFNVNVKLNDYPAMAKILDAAAQNSAKVLFQFHAPKNDDEMKNTVKFIETFKNHPAVLAWFVYDEVFTIDWGKKNYQAVTAGCKELKQLEPYHPIILNENSYGLSFLKNGKLDFPGDVISVDYYAYPPSRSLQLVSTYSKSMSEAGKKDGKPCWIYIFGGGYTFWASRDLTPAEQEFETYAAIINGIRGIHYFGDHPKSKSHWARMKSLIQEMKELAPILASTLTAPVVKCNNPAIEFLVKKTEEGVYLIAVNNTTEPLNIRFDLSAAKSSGDYAEALFENREIKISKNILEDSFADFQRHAYRIK